MHLVEDTSPCILLVLIVKQLRFGGPVESERDKLPGDKIVEGIKGCF
jgi:hypothetical protein